MRDFIYHAPTTIAEALSLLEEHGEDARPIAGGTAMVNLMKQNMVLADHLVGLGKLPGLRGVSQSNGSLHIGALTRHREVELSPEVQAHSPLLAEAYSKVATVRVRNMATVGGGLTHADPAQDPPPTLMVLDAHVVLTSSRGTRELPVNDLFLDYYESALEPGELLVLYTDGVTEARSVTGKFFGDARLRRVLTGYADAPPHFLCELIVREVNAFQGGERSDDLTLLMLRRAA